MIKITAKFLPLLRIATAKEVTMNETCALQNSTDISCNGVHHKTPTLLDVSMTISRFDDLTQSFVDSLKSRSPIVIEVSPDGAKKFRGWFISESVEQSIELSSLIEETINFQLAGGQVSNTSFSES